MNHIVPQGPAKRTQHFNETYCNIQRLDRVLRCCEGVGQTQATSKMLLQKLDQFPTLFNTIQHCCNMFPSFEKQQREFTKICVV